jgi:hypothetical protein
LLVTFPNSSADSSFDFSLALPRSAKRYSGRPIPASLYVREALSAKEERGNQDYVVAQGFWDFIQAHESEDGNIR